MRQITLFFVVALLVFVTTIRAQGQPEVLLRKDLDSYVLETMNIHGIPGLAIAVVKDGRIVYERYLGGPLLTDRIPVSKGTIFRTYSVTKLFTVTALFQLIEKGGIRLKDKLSRFFDNLPEKWQEVSVEHLLTHSSGIPDLIKYDASLTDDQLYQKLFQDKMDFPTGNQFWYNQTNYWLLGQIIEKVSGETFEEFVLKHQFRGDSETVFFSSNSALSVPNRSAKYSYNHEREKYEKTTNNDGARAHPGNGLNITLSQFIKWNYRLDSNVLLNQDTKSLMFSPFDFKNGKDRFLHGWGDYSDSGIVSYGFTGGGVSALRKYPEYDLTIILLTNGYKYFPVHNMIVEHIAAITVPEVANEAALLKESLQTTFLTKPIATARLHYSEIAGNNPDLDAENTLNSIGYALMQTKRLKDALEVFTLNVSEHPDSWNVYDSLAEGYFKNDQLFLAKVNYEKSIELNGGNTNGKVMLEIIEKALQKQ